MFVPVLAVVMGAGAPAHAHTHDAGARASEHAPAAIDIRSDHEIVIGGRTFASWDEVADSGYYQQLHTRCGTHLTPDMIGNHDPRVPSDCSFSRTNVLPAYDPSVERYRIPVVVHVIQQTNGTGFLSEARVQSQIDILNEDFLALPGTNGAPGTDSQIEFYLATEDPAGNPTNGITYSTNNTWFNDGGSYWNTLAWDTNRYLNIYTNSASGALGYVPNLPQGGIVGSNSDRVVVLYSTFGRNAPFTPFHLGRTGTHEVGHYLGLDHTFSGGCASAASCSTNGDLICDTNPESSPTFGCPGSRTSCGVPAPFHNYMDYSDDICMNQFTPDQANRMRCTLLNYRDDLYEVVSGSCPADIDGDGDADADDINAFVNAFIDATPGNADLDMDGDEDADDIRAFVDAFVAGC